PSPLADLFLMFAFAPLFLSSLLHFSLVASSPQNRTIDDELGDSVTGLKPTYLPEGGWNQGASCSGCHFPKDKVFASSQVFDGTWHDATYRVGGEDMVITANFVGRAVYVYFMVPNTAAIQPTTTFMNVSFYVDQTTTPAGSFIHDPNSSTDISYRQVVFADNSLTNGTHTLTMRASGPNESLVLFDYIVYTIDVEDPPSASSTSSSTAATSSSFANGENSPASKSKHPPGQS
ncbi:uncharacterized protein BXZ73DRAFT_54830, partial [Epithele typhae]|uniref:uncharacterized protein n=1 Tax=Epithele typhae TaxID=378194 RepID=UPI0020081F73